jgi:hypothetical protein
MSKKGNRLVLTDRKKGVLGYLVSSNAMLGSLVFYPVNANDNTGKIEEDRLI